MKRSFVFLISLVALVFALTGLSPSAHAATSGSCGEGLSWQLTDDGLLTVSGTGAMDDYTVSSRAPWYSGNYSKIKQVVIGDGVTAIGNYAFYGLSNLKEVTFGSGACSLGDFAFYCCSGLTSITIDGGIQSIGANAFDSCSKLAAVVVGDNVQTIAQGAFANCKSLSSITLPFIGPSRDTTGNRYPLGYIFGTASYTGATAVTQFYINQNGSSSTAKYYLPTALTSVTFTGADLPSYAFSYCTMLTEVSIGDGIRTAGHSIFSGCSKLTAIHLADIAIWCNVDCTDYVLNAAPVYVDGTLLTRLVIPQGITTVKAFAFASCTSLTEVVLPDSVTAIDDYAFSGCSRLTQVSFGSRLATIGNNAFSGCSTLQSLVIPDSVTTIGANALRNCTGLQSVVIPPSVIAIGDCAFLGCTALTRVDFSDLAAWCRIDFESEPANPTYNHAELYLNGQLITELVIPEGITAVKDHAFCGNRGIASVVIGDGVTEIGQFAFCDLADLQTVTIGKDVTRIHYFAFGHSPMTQLRFLGEAPAFGTEGIVTDLFYNVTTTVSYPAWLNSWTEDVRQNYGGMLTWVSYKKTETIAQGTCGENLTWTLTAEGKLTLSGSGVMDDYDQGQAPWFGYRGMIQALQLSEALTGIGSYAFYGCTGITELSLSEGITAIGSHAFASGGLQSLSFTGNAPALGQNAFAGLTLTARYPSDNETWTDSVRQSYGGAVTWQGYSPNVVDQGTCGENIQWVLTKDGCLQLIGTGAMDDYTMASTTPWAAHRTNVTSLSISSGISYIGSYAFASMTKLTAAHIPGSVTAIGNYAFQIGWGLTSLTLESGLQSIGEKAFYNCSALSAVVIPDTVTSIGSSAFSGCSAMVSLTLPANSTTLGSSCFQTCRALKNVIFPEGITALPNYTFRQCNALETISLPISVTSLGYSCFDGCTSLKQLRIPDTVTSISMYCFANCSSLTEIALPTGITLVDEYTFYNCTSLAKVTIPEGITRLSNAAFRGCTSLTAATLPQSLTYLGSAFRECTALQSITIPEGVTWLRTYAFYNCTGLKEITLPAGLATISDNAFSGCSGLNTVYYMGAQSQWSGVSIGTNNEALTDANFVYLHVCQGSLCTLCGMVNAGADGGTVCLTEDLSLKDVTVNAGTTLDLNGFTLTADALVSFGDIIDSVGGGSLAVGEFVLTDNTYLPIYDSETGSYRFFAYAFRSTGVRTQGSEATFGFALAFEKPEAYALLAESENSGICFYTTLDYSGLSQSFAFSNALLQRYAQLQAQYPGLRAALTLKLTGLDSVKSGDKVTVTPSITAVDGQLAAAGSGTDLTC